ncbi:stealth family protein [Nocardia otitidiscaviarum]|uniref:stealth family protein n=1 Tax=Nocardia otitidiscaviarum TaxID=1823 RepID=UPI0009DECA90|nr:stealth family protein [Nocardia otitidiscaviarum]MBF6131584.1 stealth family protein [Nocardia otitidiscaviarum]MBF6240290.1 stealth family protein [Nocardia otitidiscaviarum]MBF6482730.1 stealth family protein [Nocardia otitidiscaviarum]
MVDTGAGQPETVEMVARSTAANLAVSTAVVDDLRYLRAELMAAELPFLLVRDCDHRLVLAVDAVHRAALRRVLGAAMVAGFSCNERQRNVFRLGRDLDPAHHVELELWEYHGDTVECPRPNALTRTVFDLADVEQSTVLLYELSWPTLAGMFAPNATDVGFDIDIVFSWVDGSDPEFRARRAGMMAQVVVGEGDEADARIRQIDELRYALRAVHKNAPWIRRIFIATDSAVPEWLAEDPKVTIVRAVDHFSDRSGLPIFNSHAVECQLQHIEGLSEHFLYSNDDMFFARPVRPSMFFTPAGVSRFIEADTRIGPGSNNERRSGFENAARVNRALLRQRFGHVITRHLEHTPVPLRRSVLHEMEREFAADFARTRTSRFRAATDISVTNSLYHYYALFTGRAVPQERAKVRYVDTTLYTGLALLDGLAARRNVDFFCLNDGSFPEVPEAERVRAVSEFLETYYPEPAPWEKSATVGGALFESGAA